MNIASTPSEDIETPLLSSEQNVIAEVTDASGSLKPTADTQVCEPTNDAHLTQPDHIDAGVSALTLAMIIFYNVTGEFIHVPLRSTPTNSP